MVLNLTEKEAFELLYFLQGAWDYAPDNVSGIPEVERVIEKLTNLVFAPNTRCTRQGYSRRGRRGTATPPGG